MLHLICCIGAMMRYAHGGNMTEATPGAESDDSSMTGLTQSVGSSSGASPTASPAGAGGNAQHSSSGDPMTGMSASWGMVSGEECHSDDGGGDDGDDGDGDGFEWVKKEDCE